MFGQHMWLLTSGSIFGQWLSCGVAEDITVRPIFADSAQPPCLAQHSSDHLHVLSGASAACKLGNVLKQCCNNTGQQQTQPTATRILKANNYCKCNNETEETDEPWICSVTLPLTGRDPFTFDVQLPGETQTRNSLSTRYRK